MKSRHINNSLARKTCAAVLALSLMSVSWAQEAATAEGALATPGLKPGAQVIRDANGIYRVLAGNEEDLYFLQG